MSFVSGERIIEKGESESLSHELESRVNKVETWAKRLIGFTPIQQIQVETVRFDMQKINNPEISGVLYQRGQKYCLEITLR